MRRLIVLVALVAALGLGAHAARSGPATRQGATPVAAVAGLPVTPAPEECRVPPRSLSSLQALTSPTAATPVPSPAPGPDGLPVGAPADAATLAGIAATARELVACLNAGEFLRGLALYSDAFLRADLAGSGGITEEAYAARATPFPRPPAAWFTLTEVRDARLLADGRAGAVVGIRGPGAAAADLSFLIFVKASDRWLLDGVIAQVPGEAGTPGP